MTTTVKKKLPRQDWHRADIKAALEKAGFSLRSLAKAHGYSPGALRNPLAGPWPKGERIIAAAIGTTPQKIWPSRYNDDGSAKSGRSLRDPSYNNSKSITPIPQCNVEVGAEI